MGFQPVELDPEILAGTIFHRASEENQAETFAAIASAFSETKEGTEWTIQELVNYVNTHNKATIEKSLFSDAENKSTPSHFASDKAQTPFRRKSNPQVHRS